MTPLIASRAAAVDVYSMQSVSGAAEWVASGDERHLPRQFRAHLVLAAGKIARWTGGASSLALPARSVSP